MLLKNIYYTAVAIIIIAAVEVFSPKLNKLRTNKRSFIEDHRDYFPEGGPLPKSIFTIQLEEIIRFLCDQETATYSLSVEHDEIYMHFPINNRLYNLSQILQYANWSHLEFNTDDFESYIEFLSQLSLPEQSDYGITYDDFDDEIALRTEEYFSGRDPKNKCNHLHYAEKLAINIYTGKAHKDINSLLRNQIITPNLIQKYYVELLPVLITTAGMCNSGLSKIPLTRHDNAYRIELISDRFSDRTSLLRKKIDIAHNGGAIMEQGLISSGVDLMAIKNSMINIVGHNYHDINQVEHVIIKYANVWGQYIAPLSRHEKEQEILLPPTQVTYLSYEQQGNVHYFVARPVIDLKLLPEQALMMDIDDGLKQMIEWLEQQGSIGLVLVNELNCLKLCENSTSPKIMHNSTWKKYSIFNALQLVAKETSLSELAKLILDSTSAINNALRIDTAGDQKEALLVFEMAKSMNISTPNRRSNRVARF